MWSRFPAAIAACVSIASLFVHVSRAGGHEDILDQIRAVYERKIEAIDSVRVESTRRGSALIPERELYEAEQRYEFPQTTQTSIVARDGRFYFREIVISRNPGPYLIANGVAERDPTRVPFDVMRQAMRNTQPERSDERIVFNGKLLWSDRGERIERDGVSDDVVMIRNLETFAPTSALSPLHYCGIVLPLPAIPRENKSALARSLYHLLMDNQFRVSEMDQIVDDVPCVTLESKTDDEDSTKVWLAPRMGYAVVRRDSFRNGLPSFAVRCASFEEFALGIWLPREIQLTAFGWRDIHPGPFVGKPLHQTTIRLNQIALNDPESDKFLSLSPAPGKLVVDSSDVPRIPSEGIAVPNYIMPANEKDLDSVRRHAVKRLQGDRWGIGFRVFVGTTALIAGALTTWFVWRRRRG